MRNNSELFQNREMKGGGASFDFTIETTSAGIPSSSHSDVTEIEASFKQNLRYLNNETRFLASNNFSNSYYKTIVNMGMDAVPLILEEIERQPSFLVHALDEILPGVVEYGDGYISVEKACEKWISILKPIAQK